MSNPCTSPAHECACDADALAEIAILLRDSACLHYALTALIPEAPKKAAAVQCSLLRSTLSTQVREHSVKLGASSSMREADLFALSHRDQAIKALAHADHANALRQIELCDADALRRIEQHCAMPSVSADTQALLRLVSRILRALRQSAARRPAEGTP